MKNRTWDMWVKKNKDQLPETNQSFVEQATLLSVQPNEIIFTLGKDQIRFTKISDTSWLVPSSLFVPFGSLTALFSGFNELMKDSQ